MWLYMNMNNNRKLIFVRDPSNTDRKCLNTDSPKYMKVLKPEGVNHFT